jgi:hypothetical protein
MFNILLVSLVHLRKAPVKRFARFEVLNIIHPLFAYTEFTQEIKFSSTFKIQKKKPFVAPERPSEKLCQIEHNSVLSENMALISFICPA